MEAREVDAITDNLSEITLTPDNDVTEAAASNSQTSTLNIRSGHNTQRRVKKVHRKRRQTFMIPSDNVAQPQLMNQERPMKYSHYFNFLPRSPTVTQNVPFVRFNYHNPIITNGPVPENIASRPSVNSGQPKNDGSNCRQGRPLVNTNRLYNPVDDLTDSLENDVVYVPFRYELAGQDPYVDRGRIIVNSANERLVQAMTGPSTCVIPMDTAVFTLRELIGSGSYSNVYRAIEKGSNLTIAIKSYKERKYQSSEMRRAATEMAFVKFLDHPNIIRYIVCDIKRRYMYLGMEYAKFGTLMNIPVTQRNTENKVKFILKQIISAVCYLHSLSILHGDIKPENILVTRMEPQIVVKLSDFGLANVVLQVQPSVKPIGSFFYMAPELHLGFPFTLSADIFSIGVVMFELLFMKRPWAKTKREEFILQLRKRVPIKIPTAPKMSRMCTDLLERLLSYDQNKRPSGSELTNHPFLQLGNLTFPTENHYILGCDNLIKSMENVKANKFGQAFIEATEAIVHLKIYAKTVQKDAGLYQYMLDKIQTYTVFTEQIERSIFTNIVEDPELSLVTVTERLRCMLTSTPTLLSGYDMCLIGEMYINQNKLEKGSQTLHDGLGLIFQNLPDEPSGERRTLLLEKIREWVETLENF